MNDEERLKELNMGRLAKRRLKAAIKTVCRHQSTSRRRVPGRCGVRWGGTSWTVSKQGESVKLRGGKGSAITRRVRGMEAVTLQIQGTEKGVCLA